MITKFCRAGKGSAKNVSEYLTKESGLDREGATVLRGNPKEVETLTKDMSQNWRYHHVQLNFGTEKIDDQTRDRCIDEFEKTYFKGLEKSEYTYLAVEHIEKGNKEIHLVIPRVNLETGKQLRQIDNYDRFKDLSEYLNLKYDLKHNPNDPELKQNIKYDRLDAKDLDRKDLKDTLSKAIGREVDHGRIKDRGDVMDFFKRQKFEITRDGDDYLSVKAPDQDKAMRLRGLFFERDFDIDRHQNRIKDFKALDREKRLKELEEKILKDRELEQKKERSLDYDRIGKSDVKELGRERQHERENKPDITRTLERAGDHNKTLEQLNKSLEIKITREQNLKQDLMPGQGPSMSMGMSM